MPKARYPLERVRIAVSEGRFRLDNKRCRDVMMPYLGNSLLECWEFTRAVAEHLQDEDFSKQVMLGVWECDEYGLRLPDHLQDAYALEQTPAWYVKFSMVGDLDQGEVFFISLHPLEQKMMRAGGILLPHGGKT